MEVHTMKKKKAISMKNAVINFGDEITISEISKEDIKEYKLIDILGLFADDTNLSINISVDEEI